MHAKFFICLSKSYMELTFFCSSKNSSKAWKEFLYKIFFFVKSLQISWDYHMPFFLRKREA